MSRAITVEISDSLYDQLERTAELSRRPIDTIVEQSLFHSLPPLLRDVPEVYQADVYPLLEMDQAALRTEANRTFPPKRWASYGALLEKRKEIPLTKAEEAALSTLRREADILMYRKAYALLLLKRRGYHMPTINQLPQPAIQ